MTTIQVMQHPLSVNTRIRAYAPVGRSAVYGTPLWGFVDAAIESVREWTSPAGRKDYFYTVTRNGKKLEIPQTNVQVAFTN